MDERKEANYAWLQCLLLPVPFKQLSDKIFPELLKPRSRILRVGVGIQDFDLWGGIHPFSTHRIPHGLGGRPPELSGFLG